jgi:murein DD-endopeptidase MepM/ murein hydrolase activator NlpD
MGRRFLTLLVVHHTRPHFGKLKLSYSIVALAAVAGAALVAAGIVAPGLFVRLRAQSTELDQLRQSNAQLTDQNEALGGALDQIQNRLVVFEARAMELAQEIGLPQIQNVGGPVGGGDHGPVPFALEGELQSLHWRTEALDRSLGQIDDVFRARLESLRATPDGMPVVGWFSHGYGWRKDPWSGEREFHQGVDIVAPAGTDVHATADGVISVVGRYADYGRSIDVDHGHGFLTRYAHLSEVLVRPGDRVERGDRIGLVGSTGRTTGPHLHYEIFRDGRRANPWTYLGQHGS